MVLPQHLRLKASPSLSLGVVPRAVSSSEFDLAISRPSADPCFPQLLQRILPSINHLANGMCGLAFILVVLRAFDRLERLGSASTILAALSVLDKAVVQESVAVGPLRIGCFRREASATASGHGAGPLQARALSSPVPLRRFARTASSTAGAAAWRSAESAFRGRVHLFWL